MQQQQTTTIHKRNQKKQQQPSSPIVVTNSNLFQKKICSQPITNISTGAIKNFLNNFCELFKKKQIKPSYLQLSILTFTDENWINSLQRQGRLNDYSIKK